MDVNERSLVVLCGPSGSGKSTFANQFEKHEVVSSDYCRYLLNGDEADQSTHKDTFELVHLIIEKRLAHGLFTVVDATALTKRNKYLELAKKYGFDSHLFVFTPPIEESKINNHRRSRVVPEHVIDRQYDSLRKTLVDIKNEPWTHITYIENSKEKVTRKSDIFITESRPLDFIGDVHGHYDLLTSLLKDLGYPRNDRVLVFVGDYVDRGPDSYKVLSYIYELVTSGKAYAVCGNHDLKLWKSLNNKSKNVNEEMARTLSDPRFRDENIVNVIKKFIESLPRYLVFNNQVVAAHAGIEEHMIGKNNAKTREFCLYGERLGDDEHGLPIRRDWAETYKGKYFIVYGHMITDKVEIRNNTIDIDTGAGVGGPLTAFRWPEREIVQTT